MRAERRPTRGVTMGFALKTLSPMLSRLKERVFAGSGQPMVERRSGVFRVGCGAQAPLERQLRLWRGADRFRLWTRVVLSPEEHRDFEVWALRNEEAYETLVRRYSQSSDGKAREELLDRIHDLLMDGTSGAVGTAFRDWEES
jgi:hypothetical protein